MNKQYRSNSNREPDVLNSRLGMPRFKWSMALLGLCVYTFVIISMFIPVAQLGIAIGVVGLLMDPKPVLMPLPFRLFLALLLWALLSVFTSPFSAVSMDALIERFKLLVVMLLVLNALRTEGQLRFYLLLILGCFILFPARGTFIGGNTLGGRAVWTGMYENPNDLASLCLLALGIANAIIFSETAWTFVRLGAATSALILLVVILRTQSRGAFLGVMFATVPALVPLLLKQLRLAIGLGIVLTLVISFTIPPKTWDRLTGMKNLGSTDTAELAATNESYSSALQRMEILQTGWHIFVDHPIFGVGLGTYPLACNLYSPTLGKRDTHNTYLNVAAELGLPGFLIWCSLMASVLLHAYRIRRRAKESLLKIYNYWLGQTIIGYLVAAIFATSSGLNLLYMMLSVLWCSAELLAKASPSQVQNTGT